MKKCFACLRRFKFAIKAKTENKKWVNFLENYYSHHSKYQWAQLMMENYEQLRRFPSPSDQSMRELKSTNISSEVIKVIRKDYEQRSTPFTLLIEIFTTYSNHKFMDVVNPTQVTLTRFEHDVQNFVDFMRSMIVIYYNLEERQLIGDDQFFRVTLYNFIVECLFVREEFNSCVVQVVKNSSKDSQDRICFNMQKFSNLSISDYDISERFTLNSSTLALFNVEGNQQLQKPYTGAIKIVKQILKARTPIQKTKCAQNLISQVEFSIKKFYQDHQIQDPVNLDADNAIAILLYILVQSQQSQLITHLNIVYSFLNKESLQGGLRFCLDTLKACLLFLEKGNIKKTRGLNIQESEYSLWISARSHFENISHK